jgi:hypothetical protein
MNAKRSYLTKPNPTKPKPNAQSISHQQNLYKGKHIKGNSKNHDFFHGFFAVFSSEK